MTHFQSLVDHWDDPEYQELNFGNIVATNDRNSDDSVDKLLEKHAILDVIFEDNAWNYPYVTNAFPYLTQEECNDATIFDIKKKYFAFYQKYKIVKDRLFPPMAQNQSSPKN